MNVDPRCLEFIGSKVQILIQNGISVHLTNRENINNMYGGTFYARRKEFSVALGSGVYSVYTFIHEYAHFLQWRDNPRFWQKHSNRGLGDFLSWVEGMPLSRVDLERGFRSSVILERDAEKRAVNIIKEYKLPLSVKEYIKQANLNLLMYPYMRITRSWNKGQLPIHDDLLEPLIPGRLYSVQTLTDMKGMKKFFKQIT